MIFKIVGFTNYAKNIWSSDIRRNLYGQPVRQIQSNSGIFDVMRGPHRNASVTLDYIIVEGWEGYDKDYLQKLEEL